MYTSKNPSMQQWPQSGMLPQCFVFCKDATTSTLLFIQSTEFTGRTDRNDCRVSFIHEFSLVIDALTKPSLGPNPVAEPASIVFTTETSLFQNPSSLFVLGFHFGQQIRFTFPFFRILKPFCCRHGSIYQSKRSSYVWLIVYFCEPHPKIL